jgi:uncharacterized protein (TIGR01319 family)
VDGVYLLIDFGSTYTKVVAADLGREVILGRSQSPSTARSNLLEGLSSSEVEDAASLRGSDVAFLPASPRDLAIDAGLARTAVGVAVERHAGTIRESWGVDGLVRVQRGKDLTGLRTVIGTGGVFAHNPHREWVLEASLSAGQRPFSLGPSDAELYVDREYVLYGIGLLAGVAPASALRLGRKSLARIR